jgi:hypothetical protein
MEQELWLLGRNIIGRWKGNCKGPEMKVIGAFTKNENEVNIARLE